CPSRLPLPAVSAAPGPGRVGPDATISPPLNRLGWPGAGAGAVADTAPSVPCGGTETITKPPEARPQRPHVRCEPAGAPEQPGRSRPFGRAPRGPCSRGRAEWWSRHHRPVVALDERLGFDLQRLGQGEHVTGQNAPVATQHLREVRLVDLGAARQLGFRV